MVSACNACEEGHAVMLNNSCAGVQLSERSSFLHNAENGPSHPILQRISAATAACCKAYVVIKCH
jgi:hypothetical protein